MTKPKKPAVVRAAATRAERMTAADDTLRVVILAQMIAAGMTKNQLALKMAGRIGRDSIFRYLGPDATPLNSRYVSAILDALGLEVRPKKGGGT